VNERDMPRWFLLSREERRKAAEQQARRERRKALKAGHGCAGQKCHLCASVMRAERANVGGAK
jgi:hypothetical protein